MKAAKRVNLLLLLLACSTVLSSQGLTVETTEIPEVIETKENPSPFNFTARTQFINPFEPNFYQFFSSISFRDRSIQRPTLLRGFSINSSRDVRSIPPLEVQAFFCRMELKLERATGLPVRFRLGSVEYTDELEGK